MRHIHYYIVLIHLLLLAGCNLEREIEIDLPGYDIHYVVECYLEPNQNFRLLLTRSSAYFDPFSSPQDFFNDLLVSEAQVFIYHRNRTFRLFNQPQFDLAARKIYNYTSDRNVPLNYEEDFHLVIVTPEGDSIFGDTRLLPPVPIDSVVAEFKEPGALARVLTYFTDIPDTPNYFRRMLHESSLDSLPIQDFSVDDRFVENVFVFGSDYEFEVGDTVFNTIFHIDEAYYKFLETFNRAGGANGNPFSQPSPIASNLYGTARVVGIFTGLSYDRKRIIIKK